MKNRRLITVVIAISIIVAGLAYFILRPRDAAPELPPQQISIELPAGVTGEILSDDHGHGNEEQKTIATLSTSKKIELPTGGYSVLTKATDEYTETQIPFSVEDRSLTVKVEPNFSEKKLTSMLTTERPAILQAITRDTPEVGKYYTPQLGWLYLRGDWYATKLAFIGPTNTYDSDPLLLVAHKKDGQWHIVTKPPALTVSRVLYPEIPVEVAQDINNFR